MKTISQFVAAAWLFFAAFFPALPASAEVPYALVESIPPPPTGTHKGAQFGTSVAVDGGYTVVGAPLDDAGAPRAGVAKVFDTRSGKLLLVLKNPVPRSDDGFGAAVAISGSVVAVGGRFPSSDPPVVRGAVYVYDVAGATPTAPILTLPNPIPHSYPGYDGGFGTALAISGARILVGACESGDHQGIAYVYDLGGAAPDAPVLTLHNPSPGQFEQFGRSVALEGMRAVVGAGLDGPAGNQTSSAYVYDLGGATPNVPVVTLHDPGMTDQDSFGFSVALSGSLVAVGANGAFGTSGGHVYVYDMASATPDVPAMILQKPVPEIGDEFGCAVALSGARLVVGSFGLNSSINYNVGRAYVYDLGGATPAVPAATLSSPHPSRGGEFSHAIAISGMLVAVGEPLEDDVSEGIAYVYDLAGATPEVAAVTLSAPGPSRDGNFGVTALSGSLLVVGAPTDNTDAYNAGSTYIYDLGSATPAVPMLTLVNLHPQEEGNFGGAVAIDGRRVVVGAYRNDNRYADSGSAYAYDLRSPTPDKPVLVLKSPHQRLKGAFGRAVAISGRRVIVGAPFERNGDGSVGRVYVYDIGGPTPRVPVAVLKEPMNHGIFGLAVAVDGEQIVVGAPGNGFHGGRAYAFKLTYDLQMASVTELRNIASEQYDYFGSAVAIDGQRVVVGASGTRTFSGAQVGIAYLYQLQKAYPGQPVAVLHDPADGRGDGFGGSVAISGTQVAIGKSGNGGRAYVFDFKLGKPRTLLGTLTSPGVPRNFGSSVAILGETVVVGAAADSLLVAGKGAVYVFKAAP
jgi:hypothetical protein